MTIGMPPLNGDKRFHASYMTEVVIKNKCDGHVTLGTLSICVKTT